MEEKYIIILIILYVIGFLFTYYLTKKVRNWSSSNDIADIFGSMFLSLMNPITLWFVLTFYFLIIIKEYLEEHNIKPPTWL